jgi:D-alanine-D-alanine ligase
MKKIRLGLICGGKSAEHAVSLMSAQAIWEHLDREKYDPFLIYISRAGEWTLPATGSFQEQELKKERFRSFLPWSSGLAEAVDADIYFPVLHGPNGEDGRIQGLFEMAGKPFVGAGSFASQLAMDKVAAKMLFAQAGLRQAPFLFFSENIREQIAELAAKKLGFPVFVKPCSLGSSVGIRKARDESELLAAADIAFGYDRKIVVEKAVAMRELEVSVMGNDEILVSAPGELLPSREFYDYADKYLDGKTQFRIPAQLGEEIEARVRRTAHKAYRALFVNGYARVDLFLENGSQEVLVNEINTIPGFTTISMFPKLWQAQGIPFAQLLDRLIAYGFDPETGRLEQRQICPLTEGDEADHCLAADVHLTADGRFLYASVRGVPGIIRYAITPDGLLERRESLPCGADAVRNFCLESSGRFLLLADQRADEVRLFDVRHEGGGWSDCLDCVHIPSPVCVIEA